MAEAGFPGQEAETLLFIFAPAGTPDEIVVRLSSELRKLLNTRDVKDQFTTLGFNALATTPEQSSQRVRAEIAKWAKVITDANLRQTIE